MVRPADGGGDFSGINPPAFEHLIQSVKTGMTDAHPLARYYLGRFQVLGVETTSVSTLLNQHYTWAQNQQPMLNRRYELASALNQPAGNWAGDMTSAGSGNLRYPTSQAAAQAGKKAAQQYLDGKISYQQLLGELGDDPDFDAGVVKALGTKGLRNLEAEIYSTDPSDNTEITKLATAVSAALAAGAKLPLGGDSEQDQYDLALLNNLVQYATFPPATLVSLANQIGFAAPFFEASPAEAKAILTQLAHDPKASAQFLSQFPAGHDGMPFAEFVSRSPYGREYAQLFANVITAGTDGARSVDPKLAAQNVTTLVSYYSGKDPVHAPAPVQAAYAKIIASFWPDVQAAVTDPAYVKSASPVPLSASQWQAFVGEAMQDTPAAASLLKFASTESVLLSQSNLDSPEKQHAAGLIQGFFGHEAQTVYQGKLAALQQASDSLNGTATDQADKVVDVLAGIALDPEGTVLKAGTDLLTSEVTGLAEKAVNSMIGTATAPGSLQAPNVNTWQQDWGTAAADAYQYAQQNGNHALAGAAAHYAQQYHCAPFLTAGGQLVPHASTAQQQAYNAWLMDPAVGNGPRGANWYFLDADTGRIDGMLGGS